MWLFFCILWPNIKYIVMTPNELIHNIKNLRNGGDHTDDYKVSSRQLEFVVNHFRAEIASQRVNNKKSVDGFYQELTNLKVVKALEFRPYNSLVSMFRTRDRIPKPISAHTRGYVFDHVGFRDDLFGFQKSTLHTYNIDLENPHVQNLYFTTGGYMYFASKRSRMSNEIYVNGVFGNPREVEIFEGADASTLGYDWDYPLPENLVGQLNNMIINNEFRWMNILPPDLQNDGKDGK